MRPRYDNLPDDWDSYYTTCPRCGQRYHKSEGGCDCCLHPTYDELAGDWQMWQEYVDTGANMTEEEFDAMSEDERLEFLVGCFGKEGSE
jgi:ribosomal protein L37E